MALLVHSTVLLLVFSFVALSKGLKGKTEAQQNVAVKIGDDVCLTCPLTHSKDVLQVMWQKILPKEEVTVATCHSVVHKLNPVYSGKIELRETGLRNCSIVVRNVTRQDEGCYVCLLIGSSDVAFTFKTFLQMYELHGPILNVINSNSTGDLVVSCSATGRPAPSVTLETQQNIWTHNETVIVTNTNGTVTVSTTAVLAGFHRNEVKVGCSVRSPFVSERQEFKTISGMESEPKATDHSFTIMVLCIALVCSLVCGCAIVTAVLVFRKHQKNSDLEENGRKEKVTDVTPLKGPLLNENVRKRTPPGTDQKENSNLQQVSLLPTPRCLFRD